MYCSYIPTLAHVLNHSNIYTRFSRHCNSLVRVIIARIIIHRYCHHVVQTVNEWPEDAYNFFKFLYERPHQHLIIGEPSQDNQSATFEQINVRVILVYPLWCCL